MESGKKKERTSLRIKSNPLYNEAYEKEIEESTRVRLVLGNIVNIFPNGVWQLGHLVYHEPPAKKSLTESIYIRGPSGSGKSFLAYAIAGQSYFCENRTWILIDTKLSYLGNHRPNLAFAQQISDITGGKLYPRGISGDKMDVIAPLYYVEGLSEQDIIDTMVTDYYRIPLRFCDLNVMFEITKLNKKAGYASSFVQKWNELMIRTRNKPRLENVYEMIDEIVDDPDMSRMAWIYTMMKKKIQEVSRLTIDDESEWSPIGKAMQRAATEGKARWIVFTLGHSPTPEDELNLALVSTIIKEIRVFTGIVRRKPEEYKNFSLGIMIDELHTYLRDKDASTVSAIHDLLLAWGRSHGLLRIFLTQKDDQLTGVFRDDIKKQITPTGTYQCIISCTQLPTPGYVSYINRSISNPLDLDSPLYYQKIKTCPPLFEVESSEPNDQRWMKKQVKIYENTEKDAEKDEDNYFDELYSEDSPVSI